MYSEKVANEINVFLNVPACVLANIDLVENLKPPCRVKSPTPTNKCHEQQQWNGVNAWQRIMRLQQQQKHSITSSPGIPLRRHSLTFLTPQITGLSSSILPAVPSLVPLPIQQSHPPSTQPHLSPLLIFHITLAALMKQPPALNSSPGGILLPPRTSSTGFRYVVFDSSGSTTPQDLGFIPSFDPPKGFRSLGAIQLFEHAGGYTQLH